MTALLCNSIPAWISVVVIVGEDMTGHGFVTGGRRLKRNGAMLIRIKDSVQRAIMPIG